MATTHLQLPDECWESVFKFLTNSDAGDNNHRHLESLSAVSKQFLSISNHLKRSFTISDQALPFLSRLFHRFPNLTSLNLTRISNDTNLDALLIQISNSPFPLKSLNLSNQHTIPLNGLRIFSKKITTLTSLTCSNITSLRNNDTLFISNFFPFLQQLDLSNPKDIQITDIVVNSMSIKLPKLRKVNFSGHYYINDTLFFHLCKNSEFLEEVVMFKCSFITNHGIASAIRERPGLRSLSFNKLRLFGGNDNFFDSLVILKGLTCIDLSYSYISDEFLSAVAEKGLPLRKLVLQGCFGYSYVGIFCLLSNCRFLQHLDLQNAEFLNDWHVVELSSFLTDLVSINISKCSGLTDFALFTFVTKCASLSEVRMEYTSIGKKCVENSYTLINFVVNPQLKSLRLAHNTWLRDEDINKFASIFPNLQLLDLSSCNGISEVDIGQVLRKCSKIRHLNLACCSGLKLLRMDFQVSTLEVLNLSESGIDDRSLDMISKSCFGLLQLDLARCFDVTEKGVRQVVVNCTKLREINLHGCCKVAADVVDSIVFIRPSLRKLTAPPGFHCSDSKRKLFLRHGCLVC